MKNKKTICSLDGRVFYLRYYQHPINLILLDKDVEIRFTQRELRMIMKHLQNRNNYLYNKLKNFIDDVDYETELKTDWDSYIPRSPIIINKPE